MAVQYSIQKMVSDGTLSTIALGIQYLQRNDIYMRVAGEETPQSGAPSGYTWSFLDNTTLKILPVVPNGVEVVVYRRTDVDTMYNIYSQNAQFDEATIDENNQQLLYIAQEYLEQGLPGAGVDTLEYVRDDSYFTYYRLRRTDGSYSDEFTVPSASSSTKVLTRESLRRSYAEAGYNLVAGSFEAGGTLVNTNDVLLHEASGEAFSGPAGNVSAGTNPTLPSSGYVSRTDVLLRSELANIDGSGLIGSATYSQIRAYTGSETRIYCLGRVNTLDGSSGYFFLDETDTTSADNDSTILVDANGGRWKRQFSGSADIRWWGANPDQGTTDDTAAFAAAINFSALTKVVVHVPYTTNPYHVTGLDFKGKDGAKLVGSVGSEYNYPQIKTTGSASITVDGLTVFVRINDSVSVSTREVSLQNFVLLEDPSSTRNRGLLIVGAPQTTVDSITLYGFDRSLRAARLWNAKLNYIHCYKFRTSGFSSGEGNASYSSTNGLELLSFHASSDVSPAVNIDARGVNSLTFINMTTEGTCASHFLVDANTRSVNVHGIHKEGGRNFVEVDLDTFSPTVPFGNFSLFGGVIFLDSPSMTSGDKFVKPTGTRVNVGLQSLTLNAVSISKPTLTVAPNFPSDYFDLSRVAVLDTTATFNTVADATVDRMTWVNVGKSVNAGFLLGQFGHNGLTSNNYRGVYSGIRGERILTSLASAASLSAGYQVALIDTDDLLEVTLDIEVELQYNSGAFNTKNFLARFVGHIANSGALVVNKVYENGLYAKDTTFTYDRTTRAFTATNATGFGTFRLKTKIAKW